MVRDLNDHGLEERVLEAEGLVPVEMLAPGDLVCTRDDGPQPLRWTGSRTVPAEGKLAPVLIREGSLGPLEMRQRGGEGFEAGRRPGVRSWSR